MVDLSVNFHGLNGSRQKHHREDLDALMVLTASQLVNLVHYGLATHAHRGWRLIVLRAGPLIPALLNCRQK